MNKIKRQRTNKNWEVITKEYEYEKRKKTRKEQIEELKEEIKRLQEQIKNNSDISHTLKLEKERNKHKSEKSTLEKKYKHLLEENEILQERLNLLLDLKNDVYKEIVLDIKEKVKSESTAILLCSDWHIEEKVTPDTVNWLNEYNDEIAEQRVWRLFKNTVDVLRWFELETEINKMIVALLWDFITWYIHEELMESNTLSPTEAIIKVRNMIKWGLDFLLKETKYELIVPCNYWNHWRTWKEKKISTWHQNNYEWMMYKILENDFKDEPRVTFQIANWYFNYVSLYWKTLRFHHWDAIKWWWWIWWITVPINNSIKRFNQARPADLDLFWHFHQMLAWKNFIVNWSLIWTTPYSLRYWHEEPSQTLFLINSKYWRTITTPIFVKD